MSDLERLVQCALNDRLEIEIGDHLGTGEIMTSFDQCMERLKSLTTAVIHFPITRHRTENAFVHMGVECSILDHTHGGYIDAVLYPAN